VIKPLAAARMKDEYCIFELSLVDFAWGALKNDLQRGNECDLVGEKNVIVKGLNECIAQQ
jgi:hypothetical protein